MKKGLVHIYHGDGKGKTTCAIGLSIRALGAGYHVVFVQFLKGGDTSELNILNELNNIEIIRCEKDYKFTWLLSSEELVDLKNNHDIILEQALKACSNIDGKVLLVFDELCATYQMDLINQQRVIEFIQNKSDNIEVVVTGRNPAKELLELADYVSEIKKEKHPMDKGVVARTGIEM